MMTESNVEKIFDAAVRDISRKVGKLEVIDGPDDSSEKFRFPYTVYVTTTGEAPEVLAFSADKEVLRTIAQNMMHGAEVSEEDIRICTMEFFNILCGNVVSSINRMYKTGIRFSIPDFKEGSCFRQEGHEARNQWSYSYPCGMAKLAVWIVNRK